MATSRTRCRGATCARIRRRWRRWWRGRCLRRGPTARIRCSSPPVLFDDDKSLMITALPVVEDPTRTFNPCTGAGAPMGVWTFGHLMTEMANQSATGIDPADFALDWIKTWTAPRTINGLTVP